MSFHFIRFIAASTLITTAALALVPASAQDKATAAGKAAIAADIPKQMADRMAAEKEARKACKIDICKAFAAPSSGGDIKCSITKTWLRSEILSRLVGGDYVWGFGHTQCSINVLLKREALAKSIADKEANVAIGEHAMSCTVGKKDAVADAAFTVEAKVNPTIVFKGGKATSVSFGDVRTTGSTVASAAVTSVLAIDRISGLASRAAASEVNTFLYEKCKADGVVIARK